ncbi:MAG TPA: cation diffusion facilitator family transporter [Thermoplasmata archaeon]|nr:cation diffusion facilitator family transporter [Thermoplasmata archaeon]
MHAHPHGEGEANQTVVRGLRAAVLTSIAILVIEAFGAYLSRSLSLTIDALHNAPDILAFAVSLGAVQLAARGTDERFTFGAHRLEVFAGLLNAALVLGTGAVFGFEGIDDLVRGVSFAGAVDPVWLLAAAVPTLGLRTLNLALLGRIPGRVRDLNLSSVVTHLASDLAITSALLAAGVVLLVHPASSWVDEAGAIAIASVLIVESVPLFRSGWDVLGERAPPGVSVEAITQAARQVPGVVALHDVHVWSVCSTLVILTAHVGLRPMSMAEALQTVHSLRTSMEREFGILHSTFEIESASDQ